MSLEAASSARRPGLAAETGLKVYLSGPMTGLPELNFPAFHAAAARLRGAGYTVVNPAEINPDSSMSWQQCMRADIKALCDCDALALLPGWMDSKGAHLELHLAHRLELRIGLVEEYLGCRNVRGKRPDTAARTDDDRPS